MSALKWGRAAKLVRYAAVRWPGYRISYSMTSKILDKNFTHFSNKTRRLYPCVATDKVDISIKYVLMLMH